MRQVWKELALVAAFLAVRGAQVRAQPTTGTSTETATSETVSVESEAMSAADFDQNFSAMPTVERDQVAVQAFGDAATGCYSATFRIPIPTNAGLEKLSQGVVGGLRAKFFEVRNIVKNDPEYSGATSLTIGSETLTGIATLSIHGSVPRQAELLACYWNQRNPLHCETLCTEALRTNAQSK